VGNVRRGEEMENGYGNADWTFGINRISVFWARSRMRIMQGGIVSLLMIAVARLLWVLRRFACIISRCVISLSSFISYVLSPFFGSCKNIVKY
jgi:hypothetical protein